MFVRNKLQAVSSGDPLYSPLYIQLVISSASDVKFLQICSNEETVQEEILDCIVSKFSFDSTVPLKALRNNWIQTMQISMQKRRV